MHPPRQATSWTPQGLYGPTLSCVRAYKIDLHVTRMVSALVARISRTRCLRKIHSRSLVLRDSPTVLRSHLAKAKFMAFWAIIISAHRHCRLQQGLAIFWMEQIFGQLFDFLPSTCFVLRGDAWFSGYCGLCTGTRYCKVSSCSNGVG